MATYTLEELYIGDQHDILGKTCADFLKNGSPDPDERTGIELLLVKHTIRTTLQLLNQGDLISGFESEMRSLYLCRGGQHESD